MGVAGKKLLMMEGFMGFASNNAIGLGFMLLEGTGKGRRCPLSIQ